MLAAQSFTLDDCCSSNGEAGDGQSLTSTNGDHDAAYGLADWQLEEVWRRLQIGAADTKGILHAAKSEIILGQPQLSEVMVQEETLTDIDDNETNDGQDSDFGVSEAQMQSFCKAASCPNFYQVVQPMPGLPIRDPLRTPVLSLRAPWRWRGYEESNASRILAHRRSSWDTSEISQRKDALMPSSPNATRPQTAPRTVPTSCEEVFCLPRASAPARVALLSSRMYNGVLWYLFQVRERESLRYFAKRYSDFSRLDQDLRRSAQRGSGIMCVPQLPKKLPGFLQALHSESFLEKRREGLRCYVERVVEQVQSLDDDPALRMFFGSCAVGGVQGLEHCQWAATQLGSRGGSLS